MHAEQSMNGYMQAGSTCIQVSKAYTTSVPGCSKLAIGGKFCRYGKQKHMKRIVKVAVQLSIRLPGVLSGVIRPIVFTTPCKPELKFKSDWMQIRHDYTSRRQYPQQNLQFHLQHRRTAPFLSISQGVLYFSWFGFCC